MVKVASAVAVLRAGKLSCSVWCPGVSTGQDWLREPTGTESVP